MKNRHIDIECPECFKRYRDDHLKTHYKVKHPGKALLPAALLELRERARSASVLDTGKEEKKEEKKEERSVMCSIQALTDQINEENAILKQELADIKDAINNPKKRPHPEDEKEEEKDKEEKKLTKDQQKRYVEYMGFFRNNVAAATFLATHNIEESTRDTYCVFLKSFFKLEDSISQESINDFFTQHRSRAELSPDTLAGVKKVLKVLCASTPSLRSVVFSKQKERTRKRKKEGVYIPTKAEVENLIGNLKNGEATKTLGLFLEVMFVTALRPIDVVLLKASDLLKKRDAFFIDVMEKKTHKAKLTMIPESLYVRAIELAKTKESRLFDFIPEKNYRKTLSRLFKKHCIINGVALLPKAIRKASLTHAYTTGGLEAAAFKGSHSNPATTIKHYIDPKEIDKQRWPKKEKKEEKEEKKEEKEEKREETKKEKERKPTTSAFAKRKNKKK